MIQLIVLGVLAAVGLVLWLMGRKLIRPAVSASGLVLGALAGLALAQRFVSAQSPWMIAWVVGGGLAGCLLASVIYRLWMGLSMAVLLAAVAPAVCLLWQGQLPPMPVINTQQKQAVENTAQPAKAAAPPTKDSASPSSTQVDKVLSAVQTTQAASDAWQALRDAWQNQVDQVHQWWDGLSDASKHTLLLAAAVAALVGLVFGLAAPNLCAALETALTGSLLLLVAARGLFTQWTGAVPGWLPQSPRGLLAVVGLITVVGVAIQWTLWRKHAD